MAFHPLPPEGFYGTAITEIQVTHSSAPTTVYNLPAPKRSLGAMVSHVSFDEERPSNPSTSRTYFSTVTSPPVPRHMNAPRSMSRSRRALKKSIRKFWISDPVKRAYLRTSFLFAISVLVTWIPSSLNRIHSWLQGTSPFEYHVATAAVLPLQGLWNAVIFFVTSSTALRTHWRDFRASRAVEDDTEGLEAEGRRGGGSPRVFYSDLEDVDYGVAGSDVELRHMANAPGKRSTSL